MSIYRLAISVSFGCLACLLNTGCGGSASVQEIGGVILTYQVADTADGSSPSFNVDEMKSLAAALQRRVRSLAPRGVHVQVQEDGQVRIELAGVDPDILPDVQRLIASSGQLEFLILANVKDHAELIKQARVSKEDIVSADERTIGRWITIERIANASNANGFAIDFTDEPLRDAETKEWIDLAAAAPSGEPKLEAVARERKINEVQVLMAVDPDKELNFNSAHLKEVSMSLDEQDHPCLSFDCTPQGAVVLARLTSDNLPDPKAGFARRMGIVWDGVLLSAPRIMGTIKDRGRITGRFTEDEVRMMVAVLDSGVLPFALEAEPADVQIVPPPGNR